MSQETQCSSASTVPFELSQGQDDTFVDELNNVDQLYFRSCEEVISMIDSDDGSDDNDDDDDDDDDENDNENDTNDGHINIGVANGNDCLYERNEDQNEMIEQRSFEENGCGCTKVHEKPCSEVIDINKAISFRQHCLELNHDEMDLVVKSSLHPHRMSSGLTSSKKHKAKARDSTTQLYYFLGVQICRKTFCFIYAVHKGKLQAIAKSLDLIGLKPRQHGNYGKQPANSLTFNDRKQIQKFLLEYARDNALPLPGRMPNHRDAKVLLLPSDKRQFDIHAVFLEHAQMAGLRPVSLSTFSRVWRDLCPHIVLTKPATDLCAKCQKFATDISHSGPLDETQKSDLLNDYGQHLHKAKIQRELYRSKCLQSKETCQLFGISEGPAVPCSVDGYVHYSWDFAQQVHFPHHSRQVGPIYFLTPRKCSVFGVCCEGTARQVFYLADEGLCPGKGANTVLSYAHHYLSTFGLGEKSAGFSFDNCPGQNKNNVAIWYAIWRVLRGFHTDIHYTMMIAGHTKFSPDWHFGLWKAKWRFCDAETIADIARTVQQSSKSGHNIPHVVGGDGDQFPFYDWKSYLGGLFRPLKNISKFHMFRVSSTDQGAVFCRVDADSPEERHMLLRPGVEVGDRMPNVLAPPGLSATRQWYLYDTIRQFCRSEEAKDRTCCTPNVPKEESHKAKKQKLN